MPQSRALAIERRAAGAEALTTSCSAHHSNGAHELPPSHGAGSAGRPHGPEAATPSLPPLRLRPQGKKGATQPHRSGDTPQGPNSTPTHKGFLFLCWVMATSMPTAGSQCQAPAAAPQPLLPPGGRGGAMSYSEITESLGRPRHLHTTPPHLTQATSPSQPGSQRETCPLPHQRAQQLCLQHSESPPDTCQPVLPLAGPP